MVQKKTDSLQLSINELKKLESEISSKESKLEEEIKTHKTSKKFLDFIAIASKNKKPVNQAKRNKRKMMEKYQEEAAKDRMKNLNSSTFVT